VGTVSERLLPVPTTGASMSSPGDAPKPWALLFTYAVILLVVGAVTIVGVLSVANLVVLGMANWSCDLERAEEQ
jgi:hypothetical protein